MASNEPLREASEEEKSQVAHRAEAMAELRAMDQAFDALHKLRYGARHRALRWLEARLDNRDYSDDEAPF